MNPEQLALYTRLQTYTLDQPGAQFSFSQRLAQENCWSLSYARKVIDEYKKVCLFSCGRGSFCNSI